MDRAQEIAAELSLNHTAEEAIRKAIAEERAACLALVESGFYAADALMGTDEGNGYHAAISVASQAIRARSKVPSSPCPKCGVAEGMEHKDDCPELTV